MNTVVRATLADQAYRELRARILAGQLPGGQRLRSEDLAAQLGISPTPVKEALLRLEADGLVISSVRKGTIVRQLAEEDLVDIYDARILLEIEAINRVCVRGRVSPSLLASLGESVRQHKAFARRDTLDDLAAALGFDRDFHHALVAAGGNAVIAEWHLRLLRQTHTVFVYRLGNYAQSVDEHIAVLDALTVGDRTAARDLLRRHLLRSQENSLQNVRTALKENAAS
jgi:DNA-binding GntR family transcriptional regulator